MSDPAWLWRTAAIALAAAALALFLWAMFSDRPRGRRRCPRCWYDMTSLAPALLCPECGRAARSERRLSRTRRRWAFAALSLLPALAAWPLARAPEIAREGWLGLAPTPVVLLAVRLDPADPAALRTGVRQAYRSRTSIARWERLRAAGAWARWIDEDPRRILDPAEPTEPMELYFVMNALGPDALPLVLKLGRLLESPSPEIRRAALHLLGASRPAGPKNLPHRILRRIALLLDDPEPPTRSFALAILAAAGPAAAPFTDEIGAAIDAGHIDIVRGYQAVGRILNLEHRNLAPLLVHQQWTVRMAATKGFVNAVVEDEGTAERLVRLLGDPHAAVRAEAAWTLGSATLPRAGHRTCADLLRAARDPDSRVRRAAFSSACALGNDRPEIPILVAELLRDSDAVLRHAALLWCRHHPGRVSHLDADIRPLLCDTTLGINLAAQAALDAIDSWSAGEPHGSPPGAPPENP